jgi:hypothetical protein
MQSLYPQHDARVARAGVAIASEIERLELRMSRLDLTDPML